MSEEHNISEEIVSPIVKRGRGRPPKVPTGNEEVDDTPKVKRGRGRPPKVRPEGEEPAIKRPRGRPRKSLDPNAPLIGDPSTHNAINASGDPNATPVKKGRGRPRKIPLDAVPAPLWPTPDLVQFGGADPYEQYDSFSPERIAELAGPEGASLSHLERLALIKRRLHQETEKKDWEEAQGIDLEYFQGQGDLYSKYAYTRAALVQLLVMLPGDSHQEEVKLVKRHLSNFFGTLKYLRLKDEIISELHSIATLVQERDYATAKARVQALDGPWSIGTPANREIRIRESQKWGAGLAQVIEWSTGDGSSYNGLYR